MSKTLTRYAATLRQLAAVALVVLGAVNGFDLPTGVRASLVAVGGAILALEHVLGALLDPSSSVNISTLSTPLPKTPAQLLQEVAATQPTPPAPPAPTA